MNRQPRRKLGESTDLTFEIGHVLFVDIVGYSKFLINEQSELLEHLKEMVHGSEQVRSADAAGKFIQLATGDGMALVVRNSPEAPAHGALELAKADKKYPELALRMGINSGPINEVIDVHHHANVTGTGINMAQRVMDCGDAGHILPAKRVADDLAQYRHWQPLLHDLGECEVKHGVCLQLVNLSDNDFGNPALPAKFKQTAGRRWPRKVKMKRRALPLSKRSRSWKKNAAPLANRLALRAISRSPVLAWEKKTRPCKLPAARPSYARAFLSNLSAAEYLTIEIHSPTDSHPFTANRFRSKPRFRGVKLDHQFTATQGRVSRRTGWTYARLFDPPSLVREPRYHRPR